METNLRQLGVLQLMLLLQSLHKMGYERLRWFSYMAPNGCAMRCHITTANNIIRNEFINNLHKNTWYLSTGNADNGENDITPYLDTLTREMGCELLKLGNGEDKPYVEWFDHLVEKAKKGKFPIFCADFWKVPKGMIEVGNEQYPCPPIRPITMDEMTIFEPRKIVAFNISTSYHEWKERENIYECTRKFWRMSIKRARQLELCLAVLDGKVVKAYHPYQWEVVKEGKWKGRIMFEGEEERESDLLGLDLSEEFHGRQNPICYLGEG